MFRPFGGDSIAVTAGEDGRHEASCFADEVIVDFPSVATAIDRIRTAFLADERPAPVSTHVQVSDWEAREGVTKLVEVPVRCTCRRCGGRGESWTEPCEECTGSGIELLHHHLHVSVPPGVVDGTQYHFVVRTRHNSPTRVALRINIG